MILSLFTTITLTLMIYCTYLSWHCQCLMYAHLMVLRGMIVKDTLRAADAERLDFAAKAERVKEVLEVVAPPLPKPPIAYKWWVDHISVDY